MDEALDKYILELHKEAKIGDARDYAVEFFADLVLHELALEPCDRIARGLVRSLLGHRAVLAESSHVFERVDEAAGRLAQEDVFDCAMHEQVGVAADGRGKVHVFRERQAEVSEVLRLIARACHRPKQHRLDQRVVGLVLDLLQDSSEVPGLERLDARKRHAESRQKGPELFGPLRGGLVVHAVEGGELVAREEARGRHVGGDHALLDHPVRIVPVVAADRLDAAVFAELYKRLRELEIDGAAPTPLGEKGAEHLVERFEVGQQPSVLATKLGVAVEEHRGDFFVGEPRLGAHDAFEEARPRDLAVAPDPHLADDAKAIDLGVEGAEAVRQRLGQHGQNTTREVDGGAAAARLLVGRRPGLDIVGHVRDRHAEPPARRRRFAEDGVVEVAGVGAVDRHQREVPQVLAIAFRLGRYRCSEPLGHLRNGRRKLRRQPVGVDGNLDLDSGRVRRAENLDDSPDGWGLARGLGGDFGEHHLAGPRGRNGVGRHQDPMGDAGVLGLDKADSPLL